ncbi:MAG: hypothetical protein JWN60_1581, partial [Acidobacteria bacterium]|nr:hypothetical protein [Acidobacteriota bacterium]
FTENALYKLFNESRSVAVTFGKDEDSAQKIVKVLTELKAENQIIATNFLTETRFKEKQIERVTISPFGLIGTILEQMEK